MSSWENECKKRTNYKKAVLVLQVAYKDKEAQLIFKGWSRHHLKTLTDSLSVGESDEKIDAIPMKLQPASLALV